MSNTGPYRFILSATLVLLVVMATVGGRVCAQDEDFGGEGVPSPVADPRPGQSGSDTAPDEDSPIISEHTDADGNLEVVQERDSFTVAMASARPISSGLDHLRDVLAFPNKLTNFNFNSCTMSTCFDLTRCNTSDNTLKVHIVTRTVGANIAEPISTPPGESNIIHERILQIIRQSRYFEPDPSRACLFVPEDDLLDRDPLSRSFRRSQLDLSRPEQGYGMNFLIFNLYSGTWPDYRENDFSGFKLGGAILAKASNSASLHRKNYDISIPLFSYLHPTTTPQDSQSHRIQTNDHREHARDNKTYLITFKGKRYVIGSGSETRNSLYHLSNDRDVIMLTTCRHGKKWREAVDKRCVQDENAYDKYDFTELMSKSTFCLTPRGRRLGSFRFLEALNHTCVPVVLGDGWVWPFDEIIDWSNAAVQYPEQEILLVPDTLRDLAASEIETMQAKCRHLYDKYFASVDKIVLTVLDIIERRIKLLNDHARQTGP